MAAKKKNNLPENVVIKQNSIQKRIYWKKEMVQIHSTNGHTSPLIEIEPTLVKIILQMAKIRECLTPSKALFLINNVIKATKYETKLADFKKKYSWETKKLMQLLVWVTGEDL